MRAVAMLSKIALAMQPTLLIPKESPSSGRLYVILKGVVLERRHMRLLSVDDNWGAATVLHARRTQAAACAPPPARGAPGTHARRARVAAVWMAGRASRAVERSTGARGGSSHGS